MHKATILAASLALASSAALPAFAGDSVPLNTTRSTQAEAAVVGGSLASPAVIAGLTAVVFIAVASSAGSPTSTTTP